MHKYWAVFNAMELAQLAAEWTNHGRDRIPAEEAPIQRANTARRGQTPARLNLDLETGQRIPNNLLNDNVVNAMFRIYDTKQDALDFVNEITRFHPTAKWILMESCAFFEVPPTSPVMKSWNEAGELS